MVQVRCNRLLKVNLKKVTDQETDQETKYLLVSQYFYDLKYPSSIFTKVRQRISVMRTNTGVFVMFSRQNVNYNANSLELHTEIL